jgi:hypothetical protein
VRFNSSFPFTLLFVMESTNWTIFAVGRHKLSSNFRSLLIFPPLDSIGGSHQVTYIKFLLTCFFFLRFLAP